MDHNKLWKILKEMRIPDHLTCLLEICMQVNAITGFDSRAGFFAGLRGSVQAALAGHHELGFSQVSAALCRLRLAGHHSPLPKAGSGVFWISWGVRRRV